jgi:hypothetical protein
MKTFFFLFLHSGPKKRKHAPLSSQGAGRTAATAAAAATASRWAARGV